MGRVVIDSGASELDIGSAPNTGTGHPLRTGGQKLKQWAADLNAMTLELFPTSGAVVNQATTAAGIQAEYDAAVAENRPFILAPGAYALSSQLIFTAPDYFKQSIFAYGAELTSSHAGSALGITGGDTTGGLTVYGLKVNHENNGTPAAGFDIYGAWHAKLVDCGVDAWGTAAGYAGFRVRNGIAADDATGSFWTRLYDCKTRYRDNTGHPEMDYAVLLLGAANHTIIRGGNFGNATNGIYLTYESGQDYIPRGVSIGDTDLEGLDYGITLNTTANSVIDGPSIIGNRFELRAVPAGTICFRFTGVATGFQQLPPYLAGNDPVDGTVGAYISNPNSQLVTSLDFFRSPDAMAAPQMAWRSAVPMRVRQLTNTAQCLAIVTPLASTSGTGVRGETEFGDIRWTIGHNLRGSTTIDNGSSTRVVTMPYTEPDASYFVTLSMDKNETVWVTAKGTTGFTLNRAGSSGNLAVDWHLIR